MRLLWTRWRTATFLAAVVTGWAVAVAAEPPEKPAAEPERDRTQAALYLADMRRAFEAAQADDYGKVRELLERHRPKEGAADLRAWEWYYLQNVCRAPSLSLRAHAGSVQAAAWSPDGKRVASGGMDGTVKVWDVTTGKATVVLDGQHKVPVYALAWRPDGKRLASVSNDQTLKVWDAHSGKELFSAHQDMRIPLSERFLAWSPDGTRLLWLSGDDTIRVYEGDTGKAILTLKGEMQRDRPGGPPDVRPAPAGNPFAAAQWVRAVAWSPDGRRIAAGGTDGMVRVWDAAAGKEVVAFQAHPGSVRALAWSPDGRRLATAGADGGVPRAPPDGKRPSASAGAGVKTWDADTGKPALALSTPIVERGLCRLTWERGGRRLTLYVDGTFKAWDTDAGRETAFVGGMTGLPGAVLGPDGRYLLAITMAPPGRPGEVRLHDAATGLPLLTLPGFVFPDQATVLAWSADGVRMALGASNGTLKVCHTTANAERLVKAGAVAALAWAPDGRQLLVLDRDLTVTSANLTTGKTTVATPDSGGSPVQLTAWGPDGRRLVTSHADGTIKVWDMASAKEPLVLAAPTPGDGVPASRAFGVLLWSPDGKRLAALDGGGAVKAWDTATGQNLFTASSSTQGASSFLLAWSPDGKRLAVVTEHFGPARVLDGATGKQVFTFQLGQHGVAVLAWSPDGKRLAAISGFSAVLKVWDVATRREVFVLNQPVRGGNGDALAWSPDGQLLAVHEMQRGIRILELATKNELLALPTPGANTGCVWSPDGKRLAVLSRSLGQGRWEQELKLWDAETGKVLSTLHGNDTNQSPGTDTAPSWSPDGRQVSSGNTVWEAATGKVVATQAGEGHTRVFWDAAGPRWATVTRDMQSGRGEAKSGKDSRILCSGRLGPRFGIPIGSAVAWSPNRRRLALAQNGMIEVLDIATGKKSLSVAEPKGQTTRTLAWSPDGGRLASAGADGSLAVHEPATARCVLQLPGPAKAPGFDPAVPVVRPDFRSAVPLAWSPDVKRLAARGAEKTIRVCDAVSGKELFTLRGHQGDVRAVAWNPDGKQLASASADLTVRLWDTATGKEVVTLRGHKGPVESASWSPDGRRLATVGSDGGPATTVGTLRLWDAATGQELISWPGQVGPTLWSPDGQRLASLTSTSGGMTLTVWDGTSPEDKSQEPGR
jgi:WD40 repeat protein